MLLFMSLGMLLAFAGAALADRFDADADTLATATPAANTQSVNQQPGTTKTYDFSAAITNTGSSTDNVFAAAGDKVTVKNDFGGAWANASSSTSGFEFTAYNLNQAGTLSVSVPCEATTAQAVTVTLTATASNGQTLNNNPQTVTYNVTPTGSKSASCPTADAGGPYEGNENTNIALSGSGSDPDNGALTYAWDFDGDGAFDDSDEQNPTFAAPAVEADTNFTVKLRVTDAQGLTATDTATVTVKNVVNTTPVVSVTGVNNNGSYEFGDEPTPGCSVTDTEDNLSGSTTAASPDVDRSALVNGLGTVTVTCEYTDGGGLFDDDSVSYTIVDTIDPTASHQLSTAANANGWNKADFTVTLSGSDTGGSGVKELHYTINGGTEQTASGASKVLNINTEGIQDISFYAVDFAGNDSAVDSFTVRLDKTAPSVSGNQDQGSTWFNAAVTKAFTASDVTSGIDYTASGISGNSTTNPTASFNLTASAESTKNNDGTFNKSESPTKTVYDLAGNSAVSGKVLALIDLTKPLVSVTGVSQGGVYTTGAVPTPGCDTTDALSGVKTNATVNVTDVNNDGFGTFTATCSGGVDNANNTQAAPVSVTYSVKAAFDGFLQPIDGHSVNTGKYGRTYPIKWQLRDSSGALISDATAQLLLEGMTGGQKAVSCTSFDLSDTDELEVATTGGTSLRYDATSDQFIYNYKAPTTGTCYVFAIRQADGLTTQQIDFKFTK